MPVAGRAHYLLMDPQTSFHFWEAQGIEIDESLGYPDAVGCAGIAGPFKPFDQGSQKEASITSLPLVAMDSAIAAQFAEVYEDAIEHMVVSGWWNFFLLFIQVCLRTLSIQKQLECTSGYRTYFYSTMPSVKRRSYLQGSGAK